MDMFLIRYTFCTSLRCRYRSLNCRLVPADGYRNVCHSVEDRGSSLIRKTKLLAPCSRVLLEKLIDPQLVKCFGTRRFITAFTSARHLSLSWARSIQFVPPTPHSMNIHFNIILSTPIFPRGSPHQNPICTSPVFLYVPHAQPILFFFIWWPE